MMNFARKTPGAKPERFKVLYAGSDPTTIERNLSGVKREIGMHAVSSVADALQIARSTQIDCAIIDQRRESNQAALLTATLTAEPNVKKVIVLTSPENAASYEMLGSKCQVLYYPVKPLDLVDAIFSRKSRKTPGLELIGKLAEKLINVKEINWGNLHPSRSMIPIVSFIYKNTALVLLAALFSVFVSYGVMIVFFLISDEWAAPLTLSKGHDLVIKTERQIGELMVKRNIVEQRISKEQRETKQAKRAFDDANVLVNLVTNTLDGEIEQRILLQKDIKAQIKRLQSLKNQMRKAIGRTGFKADLERKFKKRLINRKTFNSSILAELELRQRVAGVESALATQRRESHKVDQSIIMLESMRHQIQLPEIISIKAANAEFVPLANQIITVKTAMKNAQIDLDSHSERLQLLKQNGNIIDQSVAVMVDTPLARAARAPVVVLFVPYENATSFEPGEKLYSCSFGIAWCQQVGVTGKPIAGEVVSVHPFFGKNMRGSFVEAILTNPEAAKQEVLHVGRPPLFF